MQQALSAASAVQRGLCVALESPHTGGGGARKALHCLVHGASVSPFLSSRKQPGIERKTSLDPSSSFTTGNCVTLGPLFHFFKPVSSSVKTLTFEVVVKIRLTYVKYLVQCPA